MMTNRIMSFLLILISGLLLLAAGIKKLKKFLIFALLSLTFIQMPAAPSYAAAEEPSTYRVRFRNEIRENQTSQTSCTVNGRAEDGIELTSSRTRYGNVGDKSVAAKKDFPMAAGVVISWIAAAAVTVLAVILVRIRIKKYME
jgi:hypothetical protein